MKRVTVPVPADTEPTRLDQFLAKYGDLASRGAAQRLIKTGNVWINGEPAKKASTRVLPGAVVAYEPLEPEPFQIAPRPFPLKILYEDDAIIVVNKPPHMVIHPAPGHADDTLVNALLAHTPQLASVGGKRRPGIVHRLDKGTSGALIVAKTDEAYVNLVRQFRERRVKKTYLALIYGQMETDEGVIEHAIMRSARDRKRMAVSRIPGVGREAVTRWEVKASYPGITFVELRPRTGRTHQLRVHLSALGHPIVGDPVYGRKRFPTTGVLAPLYRDVKALGRQALHASRVSFEHPVTQKRLTIKAPCPDDLRHLHRQIEKHLARKELS